MMVDDDVELVSRESRRDPEERRMTPVEPLSVVR